MLPLYIPSTFVNINSLAFILLATQHAIGVVGYSELDAKVENTQKIAVAVSGATDPTASK